MSATRSDSARRSPIARGLVASLGVAALAAVGVAGVLSPLDLTGWVLFDPDDDWSFSNPTPTNLLMKEQSGGSSAVHPGWVVSDFILAPATTIEFDISVAAGTGDDDIIGLGFSYLDASHSWLLDWKKTNQTFNWGQPVVINDDLAEQGLKIKRINGSYTWDGLWGGQDGIGVSTIAGPAGGGWLAGTVYHFVLALSPGHIVVTRDGVQLFDVTDASYPGGAGSIACYGFSQNNIRLENVSISSLTWIGLGQGKAGSTGVPQLSGSGPLSAGSINQLALTNAAPSSPATLVFGLSAINAPVKGGILVPQPFLLVPLGTNAAGTMALPFSWPSGIPAGLSVYFQFWIQDAGATFGLSASNGLQGIAS